jgi:hypothetical protein
MLLPSIINRPSLRRCRLIAQRTERALRKRSALIAQREPPTAMAMLPPCCCCRCGQRVEGRMNGWLLVECLAAEVKEGELCYRLCVRALRERQPGGVQILQLFDF